ncbi:MAG: hypothetical protein Barrevirus26_1, partial [Barrevirus sp.]
MSHKCEKHAFKTLHHNVQLQLFDGNGFPIDNTQFWLQLKLSTDKNRVFLSVPAINFQVPPNGTIFVGGTLRTINGFLPEQFRPTDAQLKSFLIPSNTGQSIAGFTFLDDQGFHAPPNPSIPAYVLGISFDGNITITAAGIAGGIIPPGNQVTLPTEVYYTHEKSHRLCKNVPISKGASDITLFTGGAANNGYRDSHVCDAYKRLVAFSWKDNAGLDPTTNTMNALVAVGKVVNGDLVIGNPVNLTNFINEGLTPFDTSIAINRQDPTNLVASYSIIGKGTRNANLTIKSPESIAKDYEASRGTNPVSISFNVGPANIVPANPLNADTPLTNCDQINGNIALISSDNFATSSQDKADNAAACGAIGVIIFNSNGEFLISITGSQFIPTVSVTKSTGELILANYPDPGVIGSINSTNGLPLPNNIITYRAVSFDSGITWPINGPTNLQPTGNPTTVGDDRGVLSDKYGNIWYIITSIYDDSGLGQIQNKIGQPSFWVSADKGVTYDVAYRVPITPPFQLTLDLFDYPQVTFGSDENGQYGMWWVVSDLTNTLTFDGFDETQFVGFIPISGPITVTHIIGNISTGVLTVSSIIDGPAISVGMVISGTGISDNTVILVDNMDGTFNVSNPTQNVPSENMSLLGNIGPFSDPAFLSSLQNSMELPCITASATDGRVWLKGESIYLTAYTSDQMLFKSPGPVDSNYAGPWQTHFRNNYSRINSLLNFLQLPQIFTWSSYPVDGYILDSVNSILFDDFRQSLYAVVSQNSPELSQDMRLYLLISTDNGQSWTLPYYVANSNKANRGYQCMALDTVTHDLIIGWYDGRNDPLKRKMEYFGAVIP